MGFISGLVSLLRAAPVLERFFCAVADAIRERKAKTRYDEKLDYIDRTILEHHRADWERVQDSETGQRPDPDGAPTVPDSGTGRT
jgi:hypothetical protein